MAAKSIRHPAACAAFRRAGFSLVELMVAMSILLIVLGMILTMTNQTSQAWTYATNKVEAFQGARFAFETITRSLATATLNTYYDYYDRNRNRRSQGNASTFVPDTYGRCSELALVSGKGLIPQQVTHAVFFQTPLNYTPNEDNNVAVQNYLDVQGLLNVTGFYIDFADTADPDERPSFVAPARRYRYRLMQLLEPTQNFSVYNPDYQRDGKVSRDDWFTGPISRAAAGASGADRANVRPLAENIVALVILPWLPEDKSADRSSISPDYQYRTNVTWTDGDQPRTMHQLPPVVRVAMIAVDERSMNRLQGNSTSEPDLGLDALFNNAASLDRDLAKAAEQLTKRRLNYRIFQTDVAIAGAKWSE